MTRKKPPSFGFRKVKDTVLRLKQRALPTLNWLLKKLSYHFTRPLWRPTFFWRTHRTKIIGAVLYLFLFLFLFGYLFPEVKITWERVRLERIKERQEQVFRESDRVRKILELERRIKELEGEITARNKRIADYCQTTRNPSVCLQVANAGRAVEKSTNLKGLMAFALALGRSEQNYNCPAFNCFGLGSYTNTQYARFASYEKAVEFLAQTLQKFGYQSVKISDIPAIAKWYKGKPPYEPWVWLIQSTMARVNGEAVAKEWYPSNGYTLGTCTYYVASRISVPSDWGNAENWNERAKQDGWNVSKNPIVGAIAQSDTMSKDGHVAWVEAIDGSRVLVSEMNFGGRWNRVSRRWVEIGEWGWFIYR